MTECCGGVEAAPCPDSEERMAMLEDPMMAVIVLLGSGL